MSQLADESAASAPRQGDRVDSGAMMSPGSLAKFARWQGWFPVLVVWLMFAALASERTMIPGVNEPHYLCKARHFGDPAWCGRDLFLNSANPHAVFMLVFGELQRLTGWTLTQTALVGRWAGWGCLALGWVTLVRGFLSGVRAPIAAAMLYLPLFVTGTFSGEWLIGGVEAKVFAYATLFASMAALVHKRWLPGALWAGVTVSLHPLVGLWSAIAWGGVFLLIGMGRRFALANSRQMLPDIPWRTLGVASVIGGLCALPGLLPALQMLRQSPSRDISQLADKIQVYYRLGHHLNPQQFPAVSYFYYALLVVILVLLTGWHWRRTAGGTATVRIGDERVNSPAGPSTPAMTDGTRYDDGTKIHHDGTKIHHGARLRDDHHSHQGTGPAGHGDETAVRLPREPLLLFSLFLGMVLAIAVAGLVIGWWFPHPGLLKFYWFRLADALVPIAVALWGAAGIEILLRKPTVTAENLARRAGREGLILISVLGLAIYTFTRPSLDKNPTGWTHPVHWPNWLQACTWIEQQTPRDALCYVTAARSFGFKWYAQRAEWVNPKDCPQDAANLVEWYYRLENMREWRVNSYPDGFSREELRELRRVTRIDYLIAWTNREADPVDLPPVYRNASFSIYQLTSLD